MSNRTQNDAGFTLLELLVAITLLAFLSVALAAGLRSGTRIWNRTENAEIDTNALRAAQNLVALDLTRIYPKFIVASPTDMFVDFAGGAHRMDFLSRADPANGSMMRVALYAVDDGDGLEMRYDSFPELARAGTAATRRTLLRRLRSIDFAYFGAGDDEKVPSWHDTWQHERRLPSLIRIRAALPNASASWPELVIRPMIAADVSCTYDALRNACQGRR